MARPQRLREIKAEQQERRVRRRRLPWLFLMPLVAAIAAILVYALVERNFLRPRVDPMVERTDLFVRAGETIQVNVVNACGRNGMAQRFTEFLRARKFDVPEYGTSPTREPFSKVIDRIGDPVSARKVAYALGIPAERIETEIDSTLYLRATVVIGEDYRTLRPMK
ncbi:MAG TPA: LytR C-terminal domain-containing protein [Candidatus Kapabacteria bacterium]|jgi:hypothetical protein|nr:LytR C-terminal domain-containing protein [Candidatus Kapabacteria bacterium]